MKLAHRVRTSASPAQVWEVLGSPALWPTFDLFLRQVRGAGSPAVVGQHLVGLARGTGLGIPLDVLEVVPEQRLVMRIRTAPGVTEEITFQLTPTTRGGTSIAVGIVVDGLFAVPAAPLLWLANGLNARVLAARTARTARRSRRPARGVA